MCRTPVIICKISSDRANRTPTRSRGVLLRLFSIMTGDVLYIIPLITRLLAKTKKITSHGVSFHNLFVTSIRSVDQQRNNQPKTLTLFSNRRRWGRQVTGLLPMQVNGAFHGIEKTRVIKAYAISVYGIDFSSD